MEAVEILSVIAPPVLGVGLVFLWRKRRDDINRRKREASPGLGHADTQEATVIVNRIALSERFLIEIFLRPNKTYGYSLHEKYADGEWWMPLTSMGEGAMYDTPERAESYARRQAASLARDTPKRHL